MHSMLSIVNNILLYTLNLLRVDLKFTHHTHTHKDNYARM